MPARVKICGITRVDDALAAARAGADAIGLVFYAPSPRAVGVAQAAAIVAALPPFVSAVGLFVNAAESEVRATLARVPLDLLQFHGDEEPDFCGRFARPFVKAVRVSPGTDLLEYAGKFDAARGLLLDAYLPGARGGTGTTFDWDLIPSGLPVPVVLSGGLTPENVGEAVRRVRPWAVDVSSGVEARPGIKDPAKIAAFIRGVRNAGV